MCPQTKGHEPMENMTPDELKNFLQTINSSTMVSLETLTPEKMNDYLDYWLVGQDGKKKKNPNPTRNPFVGGVFSRTRMYKIVTGFDYEESVERRRVKEGLTPEFQNEDDKEIWYNLVSKGLVVHKDDPTKFYFRYQKLNNSTIEHRYEYRGNTIERQLFESYLTKRNTEEYSNQGLDNPLRMKVVKLENIVRLNINGRRIKVVPFHQPPTTPPMTQQPVPVQV